MIWKRKWCSLAVVLLLLATMFPSAAFGADPLSDDIVILFSSDVHGQVEDNLGYAGLVAYKNEKLTTHRYVSVVDAGDAISGSMLASASEGEFTAEAMDLVGYTAAAVGVHEFDFGVKHFINTIAKNANFSYVSCNFADAKGNPVFAPYKLVNYGSTKVAYLGISDPQTIKKSTASFGEGKYSFYQGNDGYTLFEQVQKAIDQAKAEGADYVIAISHLETDEDCLYTPHAVARNTSGLTAIINGNAHEEIVGDKVVDRKGNTVLVTACGSGLQTIGEIVISDHKTVTTSLISKYQLKDAATTDGIDALKKSYREDLSQAFATAVTPLTAVSAKGSRIIENNETNLGDLCADAYRIMTGADIALVEAKALQKNIAAGDISYQDVMKALPIQEPISVIEMTGATLMDALEMSVRLYPKRNAAFLQVSGLTYDIQ